MKRNSTILLIIFGMAFSIAQSDATIKEGVKTIKTYPYSDPNPIAQPNNYVLTPIKQYSYSVTMV